jgi:hypothetical protein
MTTITLTEAIDLLIKIRMHHEVMARSQFANYESRHVAALDLAIAALCEKPEVTPARAADPATSHRSAPDGIKAGSARDKILRAAQRLVIPWTAREVCDQAGLDPATSPWKRVSELKQAGFLNVVGVEDSDPAHPKELFLISAKGSAYLADQGVFR